MENASKALLMAAGVLLSMMIISLAVLLFSNFGGTSSQIHDNVERNQIEQFNSQFTQYVGKDNVTIYDIISMANLATENNKYYEFDTRSTNLNGVDNYIGIWLEGEGRIEMGASDTQTEVESAYRELIRKQLDSMVDDSTADLQKYTVTVTISDVTQRVYYIECMER